MAKKPIVIPWKELMTGTDDPLPVLEVVSDAPPHAGAREGTGNQGLAGLPGTLSDHDLTEKVVRLRGIVQACIADRLPDKGGKVRAQLRDFEEELERRSIARDGKVNGECKETKQLEIRSLPESSKSISLDGASHHASGSFGSHFSMLLESKASGSNKEVYGEELSLMSKGQLKKLSKREKKIIPRMSSRTSPFWGPKDVDKDKKQSCNSHHKGISNNSTWLEEKRVNQLFKRKNYPENPGALKPKSTKDVVFLDEDVQPVEQIQEGEEHDSNERLSSYKEKTIYYPSRDHPECVELHQSDIKCLEPASYVSSTIMNFYIQYLQKSVSSSGRPSAEYHFCNTYFYSKLEEGLSHRGATEMYFAKLRRWWKGINIFQKAYIFLPVHRDLHWSLVIICIPAKEDASGPIILHLDSLGFHSSVVIFDNIERYLKEEWAYLNETALPLDIPFSERIWKNLPRRIERKRIEVPQQKNEYDCGLFVLYFIERFIEAAPARLKREDLEMFGSKWFHPEEASGLRKRLKGLILEEFSRLENHWTSQNLNPNAPDD